MKKLLNTLGLLLSFVIITTISYFCGWGFNWVFDIESSVIAPRLFALLGFFGWSLLTAFGYCLVSVEKAKQEARNER